MERLSKFYNYNEQKIANHINLKEWVKVFKLIFEKLGHESHYNTTIAHKTTLSNTNQR